MAHGHETQHGQKTGGEFAQLEAQRQEAWVAYNSLTCTPGWERNSIDAATQAARAQYALDKAKGYR